MSLLMISFRKGNSKVGSSREWSVHLRLRPPSASADLVVVGASVGVRGRLLAGCRLLGLLLHHHRHLALLHLPDVVHLAAPRHVRHVAVRSLVENLEPNDFQLFMYRKTKYFWGNPNQTVKTCASVHAGKDLELPSDFCVNIY